MALSVSISYSLLTGTRLGINFLDHGFSDLACGFLSPGPSFVPLSYHGPKNHSCGKDQERGSETTGKHM